MNATGSDVGVGLTQPVVCRRWCCCCCCAVFSFRLPLSLGEECVLCGLDSTRRSGSGSC